MREDELDLILLGENDKDASSRYAVKHSILVGLFLAGIILVSVVAGLLMVQAVNDSPVAPSSLIKPR